VAPAPGTTAEPGPVQRRRRGAALEDAIREAAFAELSTVGYHGFSVESVAARAQTGKASIYRRWPSKAELVMDALLAELPEPADFGIPPAMADDVTTADALRMVARGIASVIDSPAGDAIRAVKFEALADPELADLVDERFQAPRSAVLVQLLERGVARGEVRPEAVCPLVAEVLPAVIVHRMVMQRERLSAADLEQLVEQVMIPLVEVHR